VSVDAVTDAGAVIAAGVLGIGLGIGLVIGAVVVRWLHRILRDESDV
jgi:uncharacterized membrane-anchored protein YhcB (DUF1043 family)